MTTRTPGRRWLRRIAVSLAILVALAVIASFAVTRWFDTDSFSNLINRNPEKLLIEWTHLAMSPTGQIEIRELRIRSQDRRRQWYVEADRVRLRTRLLGLFDKTFEARGIRAEGVQYRMRFKPESLPDPEAETLPEIPGLELAVRQPKKGQRPPGWQIRLQMEKLEPIEEIWIQRFHLTGSGSVHDGDLNIQVHGPFEVDHLGLDWEDGDLHIGEDRVMEGLTLHSTQNFGPVTPRGLRTREALEALCMDLELEGRVASLDFLSVLLRHTDDLELRGGGTLDAELHLCEGALAEETRFSFNTDNLATSFRGAELAGEGSIELSVSGAGTDAMSLLEVSLLEAEITAGARFPSMGVEHLHVGVENLGTHLLDGFGEPRISADLGALQIHDLADFNSLLPQGLDLTILSGTATIEDHTLGEGRSASGSMRLSAPGIGVRWKEREIYADLELDLRYDGQASKAGELVSIGGTELRLRETPAGGMATDPDHWDLDLKVEQGTVEIGKGTPRFRLADGLAVLSGRAGFAILDPYLGSDDWIDLEGAVDLDARLDIENSRLGRGTSIGIAASPLQVTLGDWTFRGDGTARARIQADDGSDLLEIRLERTQIGKEGLPPLEVPALFLDATIPDGESRSLEDLRATFRVPRTELPDPALVNSFLPGGGLLQVHSGDLLVSLDAQLENGEAEAHFFLEGQSVTASIGGRELVARLDFDARLRSEDLRKEIWQLGGTTLELELAGDEREGGATPWVSHLTLSEARIELGPPQRVHAVADLRMTDTAPLLNVLLGNHAGLEALGPLMVTHDVRGEIAVRLDESSLSIERATLRSDELSLEGSLEFKTLEDGTSALTDYKIEAHLHEPVPLGSDALQSYLPAGGLIQIDSGTGTLEGSLFASNDSATAILKVLATDLLLEMRGEPLATDLRLEVQIVSDDPVGGKLRIENSVLRFDNTLWVGDKREEKHPHWWGEIRFEDASIETHQPLEIDGRVELSMRDTRPIVHVLAERSHAIRWIQSVLEIEDIEGTAQLHLSEGQGLRLEDLELNGRRLHIQAHLDFGSETEPEYLLFWVHLHHLTAAVEITSDSHHFRIFGARKWYEHRLEARLAE